MRTLEQCKAEVFCRSKKRIEKRRKIRNRVLALCIPLCLCAAMLILPDRGTKSSANESVGVSGTADTQAEIYSGGSASAIVTDPTQVRKLLGMLQSFYPGILYGGTDATCAVSPTEAEAPTSAPEGLPFAHENPICISFSGNPTVRYSLLGDLLTNETTGEQVVLGDAQLSQLKEALCALRKEYSP